MVDITTTGKNGVLNLGVQGENNARRVVFDTSNFSSSYGDGTAQVLYKPQGLNAYKVDITEDNGAAYWTLKNTDTANDGYGELEFQWVNDKGALLAKPVRYRTFIKKSVEYDESGRPPEHYVSWIDTLEKLAEKIEKGSAGGSGVSGGTIAATAEQKDNGALITITDANGTSTVFISNGADGAKGDTGAKGDKGDKGDPGADGVSPSAKVEQTETGAVITVSDASGTTTATITNGAKGETGAQGPQGIKGDPGAKGETGAKGDKGDPGTDGVSPSAKVEQTETGAVITVSDASGTTTATIINGAKGDPGAKGDTGVKGDKGDPGTDGVSPSAKVEQTETGAVITIKDASGTTTATLTNGAKGETGAQGPQGLKGETGAQGAKGETGAKGEKGDPGTSISITGTTESTDDGGENTITFSDGTTLTIKNGKTGSAGTYTAGDGITISGGVISVSYGNAEEASV